MADMLTPKPRQPKGIPRHEIGLSHTPTQHQDRYVNVYDMVAKDFDEKMEQQHQDIENQYAFETEKRTGEKERYSTTIQEGFRRRTTTISKGF